MKYLARSRTKFLSWLTAGLVSVGMLAYFVVRDTANYFVENQAIAVAEIVVTLSKTARSVYSQEVVTKLQKDGTGANPNYPHMRGFIPIPAQFLKLLGQASTANTANLFQYKPMSKWNLDASQGLSDDFLHWAWPQLEVQDQPNPTVPIAWKPVWRIEQLGDQRVLRYLVADPAASAACVDCHNSYENRPQIIASRLENSIPTGKQWRLHQLLGALSVTVPLDKIEILAAQQIRRAVLWIVAILVASLATITVFLILNAKQRRRMALLSWQATHDALTELPNRRGFERSLQRFWESANEDNVPGALIMIDLDGLKPINDTYGHHAGDEVLKMVARILKEQVRLSDVAARLGGDEFGVLLHGCPLHLAQNVAETIRRSISEAKLDWEGNPISISASIGLASINSKKESARFILEAADTACYVAKKSGKNRVFTNEP